MRLTLLLERLVRSARPDAPYSVHAEAELARITGWTTTEDTAVHSDPNLRRTRRVLVTTAVLALIAVALMGIIRPTSALAVTPPMLPTAPVPGDARDWLLLLSSQRLSHPDHVVRIESRSWALAVGLSESGTIEYSNINPHVETVSFLPDGGSETTIAVGEPFPGQSPDGLESPGTVIQYDKRDAKDTVLAQLPAPPPVTSKDVGPWLAQTLAVDPTSPGQVTHALAGLLTKLPLRSEQEAALLAYLAELQGFSVIGQGPDRLGRPTISFASSDRDPGSQLDVLHVSAVTGEILAIETIYEGPDLATIKTPAVTSYTAWTRS